MIDDILNALIAVSPSGTCWLGGMAITHKQTNGLHVLRLARTDRYPDAPEIAAIIAVLTRLGAPQPGQKMADEAGDKVIRLTWPVGEQPRMF